MDSTVLVHSLSLSLVTQFKDKCSIALSSSIVAAYYFYSLEDYKLAPLFDVDVVFTFLDIVQGCTSAARAANQQKYIQ